MAKFYKGVRLPMQSDGIIYVIKSNDAGEITESIPLNPRYDVKVHSSNGFKWGGFDSGCAQTAIAILCDALKDDFEALSLHEIFKQVVISKIDDDVFYITKKEVETFISEARDFDKKYEES